MLRRRDKPNGALAVIKEWQPFSVQSFGVVFDDKPKQVFYEDLLRRGRNDWSIVPWEDDDIWNTSALRPACATCFHPLGQGAAAWTRCVGCNAMEPGVSSASMGKRVRSNDPYRNEAINYTEPSFDM